MRLRSEFSSRLGRRALVETIRYAFPKAWSAGRSFCLAMALAGILAAAVTPIPIVIVGILVDTVKESIGSGTFDLRGLTLWVLVAGVATLLVVVSNSVTRYAKLRLGDELTWRMQREVLQHAARLDLGTLEDKETQDVLERANQEPGKAIQKFADGLLQVVSSAVQVVGLAGVLLWIAPFWSSVLLILGLPFILSKSYLSLVQFHIKRNKTTSRRWARYYAKQVIQRDCVPSTKLLGLAPLLLQRHRDTMRGIFTANQRFYRLQATANAVSMSVSIAVLMIAVVLLSRQAILGVISPGALVTFWIAAGKLRGSLASLGTAASGVWDAQLSIANTREFLDLKPSFESRGTLRPSAVRGEIRLNHVSFSYPRSKRPVLQDLSLCIRAGETAAIVGHNGAGKTTLAKLITRLYPVTEGEILIDGIPIDEYDLEALHDRLAFVFQHPARYEATALDNIAFGDWKRLLDRRDEVRGIAAAAHVDEMIRSLPDGYDTLLGRTFGDHDLSGGQWQKLSIARALACDPSIVILDEPAANLDVNSEYALYQGIRELIRGRTTILISHRFSTVRMADRIFVLDEGHLVEEGSHEELVRRGGPYSAMCKVHEATLRLNTKSPLCDLPVSTTEVPIDY
jgi:ATP-binding cassette subfamily B protein